MKCKLWYTITYIIIFVLAFNFHSFQCNYILRSAPITSNNLAKVNKPSVALYSNYYIVTWSMSPDENTSDISYRIFQIDGSLLVTDSKVNTISGYNIWSAIAVVSFGGFVIIWYHKTSLNSCLDGSEAIYAKYYSSADSGGSEVAMPSLAPKYCVTEVIPSVIFSGGNFIVCSNAVLQMFTKQISLLMNTVNIAPNANAVNTNCVLSSLNNGRIAAAYLTPTSIYYVVLNDSNLSFIIPPTPIYIGQKQYWPSVSLIYTNQFIITWLDNLTNLAQQTFDITNGDSTSVIHSTYIGSMCCAAVKGLSGTFYIIAYGFKQLNYKIVDGNVLVDQQTATGNLVNGNVAVDGNAASFVTVHSDGARVDINIAINDGVPYTPKCTNLSIMYGSNSTKVQIMFNTNDSNTYIYITSKPTQGILTNNADTQLDVNIQYTENDVYYTFKNAIIASDTFSYTNSLGGTACQFTVYRCYVSCSTCTITGDSINHKCIDCDVINNYFPLEDNSSNCYLASNQLDGYYLDNTIWKKCYTPCKTCPSYPTDPNIDMKCTACIDGYVLQDSSCYTIGNVPQRCYQLCKSCTGYPSDQSKDMMCKSNSCIANYYPKVDNMTSCFTGDILYYYFDGAIYQKCYPSCLTCNNIQGTDVNNQCKTCIANYFPRVDMMYNCFTGDMLYYYFDGQIYQKCHPNCLTCNTTPGNNINNQCKTCTTNFSPKIDEMYNCFTGNLHLYYFDGNVYQKCYHTCLTCNTQGTDLDHQCVSCLSDYSPKIDNPTSCFTGDQEGYYFADSIYEKCYPSCKSCKALGSESNHQCIGCISNYYPKVDNLLSCFTGEQVGYYLDNNIYKVNNEQPIALINPLDPCKPSPCLNNGICAIALNKFQCNCTEKYIGSICQYEVDTINIQDLINNYYQTRSQQSINDLISLISKLPNLMDTNSLEQLYQSIGKAIFN
jgi:hypothetical protein